MNPRKGKYTVEDLIWISVAVVLFLILKLIHRYCWKSPADATHGTSFVPAPLVVANAQYMPLTPGSNIQRSNQGNQFPNSNQGNTYMHPNRTQGNAYLSQVPHGTEPRDVEVPVLATRSCTVPPGAFPSFPTDDTLHENVDPPSYNQAVMNARRNDTYANKHS